MLIEDLRQVIIQRLQPLGASARIVGDDTEGEAGTQSQVTSDYIIRVGYTGATFTPPDTVESIIQSCDRSFQVAIEIRDLRSEAKATSLLDQIEQLLIGYHPCVDGVTGKIYGQGDRFIRNQDGIYFYAFDCVIPTVFIEN